MANAKKKVWFTVTEEYLAANPDVAAAGYKAGQKKQVEVSKKEAGLNEEETAAELKAALIAAAADAEEDDDDTDTDEEDVDGEIGSELGRQSVEAVKNYMLGNAASSNDREKSIDESAKWLKGDIIVASRKAGSNTVTQQLFWVFAQVACEAIDAIAAELKSEKPKK